eukprot:97013_1
MASQKQMDALARKQKKRDEIFGTSTTSGSLTNSKKRKLDAGKEVDEPPSKKSKKHKRRKKKQTKVFVVLMEKSVNCHDGEKETDIQGIYTTATAANKHAKDVWRDENDGDAEEELDEEQDNDGLFDEFQEGDGRYNAVTLRVWVKSYNVHDKYQ